MIKYEYKKIPGYEQKKFIENGHTMLEEDVLQRLKSLAYLERQTKKQLTLTTEELLEIWADCKEKSICDKISIFVNQKSKMKQDDTD
jgi:hypothetical protein